MIRDRMPDLCATRSNSTTFGRGFLQDIHIQLTQNKKLKEVLHEVEEIRVLIHLIMENIQIVKNLHNNILLHTNKDIQKELDSRRYTISQTAFCIQKKLRDMREEITPIDDLTLNSIRDGPAHMRIKALQYTTMLKMYSDIIEDYNISLARYHDKCLLLLQQQRTLIRKNITSQELNDMVDAQENSLFVDNILEESRIAKQQLSDIQMRHKDVLKLEKCIVEVQDMFHEIAFLIEQQGDQINNIEYFAGKTKNNVDTGKYDLKRAMQKNHRYKKRKIKIGIILGIIIIFILLIAIFL